MAEAGEKRGQRSPESRSIPATDILGEIGGDSEEHRQVFDLHWVSCWCWVDNAFLISSPSFPNPNA